MNKHKLKQKQKLLRERTNKKYVGFHVYRSVNENLPFIFWERLTDEPIQDGNFNDQAAELGERYYYRLTQVDAEGNESAPVTPKTTFTDMRAIGTRKIRSLILSVTICIAPLIKTCRLNSGNGAIKNHCRRPNTRTKAYNRARFIFITFAPLIQKGRKARRLKSCALSENKDNSRHQKESNKNQRRFKLNPLWFLLRK